MIFKGLLQVKPFCDPVIASCFVNDSLFDGTDGFSEVFRLDAHDFRVHIRLTSSVLLHFAALALA